MNSSIPNKWTRLSLPELQRNLLRINKGMAAAAVVIADFDGRRQMLEAYIETRQQMEREREGRRRQGKRQ